MLNSNFDLRTFLAESKNPTLSEGAKFKVGDMVKLSGGEPTEVLAVRKMMGSDLHAYSIENSKGERAEYDETQLTAADVSEVLSEATVMEYIREKMGTMNKEVRTCMREYLNVVNEIDLEHEDAHAQLMAALEDFYGKLKAHFEADAAGEDGEVPLQTNAIPVPIPASPLREEEEEEDDDPSFGAEGDEELDEARVEITDVDGKTRYGNGKDGKPEMSDEEADEYIKNAEEHEATPMGTKFSKVNEDMVDGTVKVHLKGRDLKEEETNEGFLDRLKKKPAQSSAKVLSAEKIQHRIDNAETGTIVDILDDAVVQQTIDLRNATPEQIKTFVSVAREADAGGDTVTGDNYMSYLETLPNYGSIEEVNKVDGVTYPEDKHTLTPDELGYDVDEVISPENQALLMGLGKAALSIGSVPAFMALLYKLKDNKKIGPSIQKFITALEDFNDA